MKIIERVVKSAGSPGDNDLWLKEEGDNLSLKAHHNGSWRTIVGSGGSEGGSVEGVYGLRLWSQAVGSQTREAGSRYYWIGNFGDLADAVDAWKAGALKDIYLDQSYHYGEENYGSGRINVNDYNYIHCPDEYDEDFYQITALVCSGSDMFVRQLTFDNSFTTDSMRFMGDVYESTKESSESYPIVIGGSSRVPPPLVFYTGIDWINDECITSCVMTTVDSVGTPNVSRLVPASGYYYSFRIDSPLQLDGNFYYGTVREVVEEPDPGTLPDGASGSFVLNEDLAKSLVGKRVIVKVTAAPA